MMTFKVNPCPRCPSSISSTSESIDHDHTGEASIMNVPRKEPVAEAERSLRRGGWFGATAILAYLASFKLVGHLLTNGNYGYFRDELYYMAAGERLHPPLARRLYGGSSFLPCRGWRAGGGPRGIDGQGAWRGTLRPRLGGAGRARCAEFPRDGHLHLHGCVRPAFLGLGCFRFAPDSEAGPTQALAPIRAHRGPGGADQDHHALLRLRRLRRLAAHVKPQTPAHSVAVVGWRDRVSLPPSLRHLADHARLAHAGVLGGLRGEGGPGLPDRVPRRAGADDATAHPAALARGPLLLSVLPGWADAPSAGLDLRPPLRPLRDPEREILLPRTRLPHAVRRGRVVPGASRPAAQLELAQARLRSCSPGRRYSACTHGGAHPSRRDACEHHRRGGRLRGQAGAPRRRATPAALRRQVRLEEHGGDRGRGLRLATGRGSLQGVRLHRQLRRSGGHRLLRPGVRAPRSHKRSQQLLHLGTRRLHRRGCHLRRCSPRGSRDGLR